MLIVQNFLTGVKEISRFPLVFTQLLDKPLAAPVCQ